jgi:hypothetical protein
MDQKHAGPVCIGLLLAVFPFAVAAGPRTVVPREDAEAVLHNPGMGWVLYENYALDPRPAGAGTMNTMPEEAFAGCDAVAVMFAWSDVEQAEGRFDWRRVDEAWDYWLQRGKEIHLRMSTEPLFGWSRVQPPGGLGIPDWLLDRIPADQKKRREDGPQFGWHVDARNVLYQERLRLFLKEANAHFSGPLTPALVDLRGFGRWGEWHSGYPYASLDERRSALRAVLEIWSTSFPTRLLALSYSHDPDGPAEFHAGPTRAFDAAFATRYEEYLRYSAFDLALAMPNITLRRDGAGGAVCSNQRKLCEHVYRDLRRAPQASEFVTGYAQARPGGAEWLRWMVDDALSLHPNYIGLLGYSGRDAQAFMNEQPDLVAHGLRGMGYRLVPLRVTMPERLAAGQPFTLDMEWINRAAGRALQDFTLRVRLADEQGEVLAQADAVPLPTSQWLQGDVHQVERSVTFAAISGAAPRATLLMSLHDPSTGRAIQLPLAKRTRDEFYEIGELGLIPSRNRN